jgi:endonuclease YncB( thermonuclease family)
MFRLCSGAAWPFAAWIGLATSAAANDPLPGPIPATVVAVTDGDTLEVRARIWLDQEVTTAVRLKDVQAPEIRRAPCPEHEEAGREAKAFVEALGLTEVTLADVEHDKYGSRVAARVVLADGRDLSALLIETGNAWVYGEEEPYCSAGGNRALATRD